MNHLTDEALKALLGSGGGNEALTPAMIAAIATIAAAAFALINGIFTAWIAKRSKDQELFLKALEFLTGGTQNRSVGIAIIKKYTEENGMKDVAATIFLAQMLHLFDSGYGGGTDLDVKPDKEHVHRNIEEYNFHVMKGVIEGWGLPEISSNAKEVAHVLKLTSAS